MLTAFEVGKDTISLEIIFLVIQFPALLAFRVINEEYP
jgi:hypothetical protein